jgi:small-conductance mechanosensitive channel
MLLLVAARYALRRFGTTPLLDIAVPLLVALAVIRMVVYGLRRLFEKSAWLKTSERTVSFTMWGLVILHFVGVLPEIAKELNGFVIPVGRSGISLLTIFESVAAVILTLIVTLWISSLIERRLLATALDPSLRVVLTKLVRAVLLVLGVLIALNAIGFDMTLLTVVGGALGVGIGLGLQKLAANYIAGFTILLDRSVRMHDLVTVGDRTGFITRLTSRYVVVRSLDGIEAIVPNETMVTSVVLNHSHSSREIRLVLPVQIADDSDVERALALMEEAARTEPRVLGGPNAPAAFLTGFGDNAFNLELGVWISDPESGQGNLRSALNVRIWKAFVANGIQMPTARHNVRQVQAIPEAVSGDPEGGLSG